VIGNDYRQVILGREQLVVRANRVRLLLAVEVALGFVDVGAGNRVRRSSSVMLYDASEVGLAWMRTEGFLSAPILTRPTPGSCENLLGKARVGQIFNLVERQFLRRSSASVRIGESAGLVLL